MTTHGGSRARGLAAEMKELRRAASLTLQEVADVVDIHISTLSRAETGVRPLTPEDTAAVLTVYRVSGTDRARLMQLTRQVHRPDWWEPVADGSRHLATLVFLESSATRIIHAAMLRIPGLLQTADYARTVMMIGGISAETAQSRVAVRLKRQAVLTKRKAPHYLAIVDEGALRRVTGSRSVMADQLGHLTQVASLPTVDLRVIPIEHGSHAGLSGSYAIMHHANSQPTLYFEHAGASLFIDGKHTVDTYHDTTDRLLRVALSSADSVRFLQILAVEFAGSEK